MKKNIFFWLKLHCMAEDAPAGDDGDSLIPPAGGGGDTPPADPPETPADDDQSWFKSDKYKTVEDQAKAYTELEKKLGERNEIIGAPEDGKYELTLPEGIQVDFTDNDPRINAVQKYAADNNLSQGAFTGMLHAYLQGEAEMLGVNKETEIKALGDNADRRIDALGKWGSANLSHDAYEVFRGVASSAAGVELLEAMIGQKRDHALGDGGGQHDANGMTPEKLKEMQAKTDANGNKLMSIDPAYRKKVKQAYNDYYGEEPKTTIIGR